MPTISQSSRIDTGRISPRANPILKTGGSFSPPPEENPTSTLFRSSLPPIAANYDLYHRQFRFTSILSTTRILPINL